MRKALLPLLLLALQPVAQAQAAEPSLAAQKATALEAELPFVKNAPTILKVPMSYRILPLCSKDVKATALALELKIENDPKAGSVALMKPEQLPPAMAAAPGCPQCTREKALSNAIGIEVSNWLRTLPTSRQEELAATCSKL